MLDFYTQNMSSIDYIMVYFNIFLKIFIRYTLFSGLVFLILHVIFKQKFKKYKIQDKYPNFKSVFFEFRHSFYSFLVFSLVVTGMIILRKSGFSKFYLNISDFGIAYFIFSVVFLILAHDTYFYWMHRLIHNPKLFNLFHKVHHESYNPTPMATFSFHPLEAFAEVVYIVIISFIIPLNPLALAIFSSWSLLFNVAGHMGYEFFPKGFTTHKYWKWLNTSTHHNLHHQKSNKNFGIYFNFWDRIMNTNHEKYHEYFEEVKLKSDKN